MPPANSPKTKINAVYIAILVAIIGLAAYFIERALSGPDTASVQAFYTTDEGQTVFADSMDHFPPFDHDGKPAYRVWMFTTDGGKTKFPGYLERFKPQAKAKIETALQDFRSGKTHMPPGVGMHDTQVKKPGANNPWVDRDDLRAADAITKIQAPPGTDLEVQLP